MGEDADERDVSEMLDDLDTNRDGVIDLNEFLRNILEQIGNEQ